MTLPEDDLEMTAVVLRTDFSDPAGWAAVAASVLLSEPDPYLFVSDEAYAGLDPDQAHERIGDRGDVGTVYLADTRTMHDPEHPLLVVGRAEEGEPPFRFRILPSTLLAVHSNLFTGNVSPAELVDGLDPDQVLREA